MFPYKYTVVDISEGDEQGFKAIIPAFPYIYAVADSVEELHSVVQTFIQEEIKHLKTQKKQIPFPDNAIKCSGVFTLRINPKLHKRITEVAESKNLSTNKYVENLLEKGLSIAS